MKEVDEKTIVSISQGYASMYNPYTQDVFDRLLSEYRNKMMEEWQNEKKAAERYGKFKAIKWLKDKSKYYYELSGKDKPIIQRK
ncbi:MAG: hypothetical protein ACOZAL_01050 [Patescibacteria group bacterium]